MGDQVLRILCVGHDSALLETRCMVLEHYGYRAEMSLLMTDASKTYSVESYDLLVLSKSLSDEERVSIRGQATESVTILQLDHLVGPDELLTMIEQCALTANRKAVTEI